MTKRLLANLLLAGLCSSLTPAGERTIGVFVALADNQHQGILRVPEALGRGDDPEKNLYWGAAEGLKGFFDRSREWRLKEKSDTPVSASILRIRVYRNAEANATLRAMAYQGSAIQACLQDFEAALRSGAYDLAVYIGHNALMDFDLPVPARAERQARVPECAVLCCKSERYFKARIESAGARPLLLTTQLMYPGALEPIPVGIESGCAAQGKRGEEA